MRLLLVEDDPYVGAAAKTGLSQNGLVCDWVRSVAEFNAAMDSDDPF